MANDSSSNIDREIASDRRQGYQKFIRFTAVNIAVIILILAAMALFLT